MRSASQVPLVNHHGLQQTTKELASNSSGALFRQLHGGRPVSRPRTCRKQCLSLPSQQRSTHTKLEPAVALPGVTDAGAASQLCLDLKPVPLTNTHSQDICSNPAGPVGEFNFFERIDS